MKTGNEATAFDLMNPQLFFLEAKADIDLLPGAILNTQLLLSR